MCLVDEHEKRRLLGGAHEQIERTRVCRVAVPEVAVCERFEDRGHRGGARRRQRADAVGQRTAELSNSGERIVAVRILSASAEDAQASRAFGRGVEQCGLTHSAFPADHEHAALAAAGRREGGVDPRELGSPSHQRRRVLARMMESHGTDRPAEPSERQRVLEPPSEDLTAGLL